MIIAANICTVVFIALITYGMVAGFALRRMIDAEKFRAAGPKIFGPSVPPQSVLTPLGVKIWWSRWMAFGAAFLFICAS